MDKLNLYPDPGTEHAYDEGTCERLKFYESSVPHRVSGDRLLSVIAIGGDGMRITEAQAQELRDWLDGWLNHR